ncbi:hypothetical protein CEUSTIGMA_g6242.t1 [Chlamydomonas eustigma]|uniref:CBM20 domain-containing protein n=1 Tax=Chlamydomonas eustigma TaxID=1157962 RepID=A0A250X6W5_9CHLO|nr:hypothetical protein CEUSTIGMA_g6242.t1 [Chlamydomonas eustigma]|eukprot:GAX78805.1 hypothetical protein CEUSTIGMA_g6242.t1 [Chlamydomonas eustigma]
MNASKAIHGRRLMALAKCPVLVCRNLRPRCMNISALSEQVVPISFEVQKQVEFGSIMKVVGDSPLGNWDVNEGISLEWSEGHVWRATVDVPANEFLSFKLVKVGQNRSLDWETGPDRSIQALGHLTVACDWNDTVNTTITPSSEFSSDGHQPHIAAASAPSSTQKRLEMDLADTLMHLEASQEQMETLARAVAALGSESEYAKAQAQTMAMALQRSEEKQFFLESEIRKLRDQLDTSQALTSELERKLREVSDFDEVQILEKAESSCKQLVEVLSAQIQKFEDQDQNFKLMLEEERALAAEREEEVSGALKESISQSQGVQHQVSHLQTELGLAQADQKRIARMQGELVTKTERILQLEMALSRANNMGCNILSLPSSFSSAVSQSFTGSDYPDFSSMRNGAGEVSGSEYRVRSAISGSQLNPKRRTAEADHNASLPSFTLSHERQGIMADDTYSNKFRKSKY